jgi:hypothetical protein
MTAASAAAALFLMAGVMLALNGEDLDLVATL